MIVHTNIIDVLILQSLDLEYIVKKEQTSSG